MGARVISQPSNAAGAPLAASFGWPPWVKFHEQSGAPWLEFEPLKRVPDLLHGFTLRSSNPASSENRREQLKEHLQRIGLPRLEIFLPKQVHGNGVWIIGDAPERAAPPSVSSDAIVSGRSGLWLGVQVADCLPIFLVDPAKRVVTLIHAGWRSTFLGVIPKTLLTLGDSFASTPDRLVAVLGPTLQSCCAEVGPEVALLFPTKNRVARNSAWVVDFPGMVREQLLAGGLSSGKIFVLPVCTRCGGELFCSYRREGREAGRMFAYAGFVQK